MKKHYRVVVGDVPCAAGVFDIGIKEYYLLKEGWIECEQYRPDPHDIYYMMGTYGCRGDFCLRRDRLIDKEMCPDLLTARMKLKKVLSAIYNQQTSLLGTAYNEIVKQYDLSSLKSTGSIFDE